MNKHSMTCTQCGDTFTTKSKKYTQCAKCRYEKQKAVAASKGACNLDDCDKAQFCKGMCQTHYWADRQAKAPRGPRYYDGICAWCDKPFRSQAKQSKHCSHECGMKTRSGLSKSTEIVRYMSPARRARSWAGHALPVRTGAALAAGPCTWCGNNFIGRNDARYCSDRCSNNASWKRKYDARGEFYINPRVRQAIYERDAWTCQICNTPVPKDANPGDLDYPTLDHIIPQSLQLIPDHSPNALRLAHMICNAKRGNRIECDATA